MRKSKVDQTVEGIYNILSNLISRNALLSFIRVLQMQWIQLSAVALPIEETLNETKSQQINSNFGLKLERKTGVPETEKRS